MLILKLCCTTKVFMRPFGYSYGVIVFWVLLTVEIGKPIMRVLSAVERFSLT